MVIINRILILNSLDFRLVYYQTEDFGKAKIYLNSDRIISLINGNINSAINSIFTLTDIEISTKNYQDAEKVLLENQTLINNLDTSMADIKQKFQIEYAIRIGRIAIETGHSLLAEKQYQLAIDFLKTELLKVQQKDIEYLNNRYSIENSIITLETIRYRRNLFILFLSFLFLFIIIFIIRKLRVVNLLKKLNGKNEKQRKELEILNAQKNKLFTIIAHDLRGPLGNLYSLLDMHKNGIIDDKELFKFIEEIKLSLNGFFGLFEELVNWAKLGMDHGISSNITEHNPDKLIQELLKNIKPIADAKHLFLQYENLDSRKVLADYNYLSLILRNFLQNAIKFSTIGNSIQVNVSSHTSRENCIVISIQDNGIGMDKEKANNLFSTLKIGNTIDGTIGEKGSGVGLFICKEFADAMDAKLTVKSSSGKGCVFSIELKVS